MKNFVRDPFGFEKLFAGIDINMSGALDDLVPRWKPPATGPAPPKLLGPGTVIGSKIQKQMSNRGWNQTAVEKLIRNPYSTRAVRDTRHIASGGQMDDPATAYINRQGHYVIRNNRTGEIVQVSDRHNLDWAAPWD